jgi:hypothetical protein
MKRIIFILICVIMAFGATASKSSMRTVTPIQQKVTTAKTVKLQKISKPVLVADAIFQSNCGETWYYTGPPLDASQIDYIFFLINGACITGETFFFLPW